MSSADLAAEERWAAAQSLAAGEQDSRLAVRRRRTFIWIGALIVVAWVIGIVLALVTIPTGHAAPSGDISTSQVVGQFVFLILGFGVGIIGFVWAYRTGHYITRWKSISSPLSRAERKSVRKQIAGKAPLDQSRLQVIVAIARQGQKATLGIAPIYAAILLLATATAIGTNSLVVKFLELAVGVLFVIVAAQLIIFYRRAGRFVESHSAD